MSEWRRAVPFIEWFENLDGNCFVKYTSVQMNTILGKLKTIKKYFGFGDDK
jgi:hypothetical protein